MVPEFEFAEQQNSFKVELIHADLETAIAFAKLALQSDDEREIIRHRQKACQVRESTSQPSAAKLHLVAPGGYGPPRFEFRDLD